MKQKCIATIQDISCFGQCSLTVALPIISAFGIECAVIPTALLSTHTGEFEGFTFCDLKDEMPKIKNHWQSLDLSFDGIYTGYLGSITQIEETSDFIDRFNKDNTTIFIDPVMGDGGSLYSGLNSDYPEYMLEMCKKADIISPNLTEAMFLLGIKEVPAIYSRDFIIHSAKSLSQKTKADVIITGVTFEDSPEEICVACFENKSGNYFEFSRPKIRNRFHGAGDVFASAFFGSLMKGSSLELSVQKANAFVFDCIQNTLRQGPKHWYGLCFEDCLKNLFKTNKNYYI